jgi:hypothetical protein
MITVNAGRTNLSRELGIILMRGQGKCVITVLVNFMHGIDRISLVRTFISAVSFDPRKAQVRWLPP